MESIFLFVDGSKKIIVIGNETEIRFLYEHACNFVPEKVLKFVEIKDGIVGYHKWMMDRVEAMKLLEVKDVKEISLKNLYSTNQ